MSISVALNAALSGLRATARQADLVANNVANATTPGYARRSLALSAMQLGGLGQGVRVTGVQRHSNLYLLNDRRMAQAGLSAAELQVDVLARIEGLLGEASTEGSILARLQGFESALIFAAAEPQSNSALARAVLTAQSVVKALTSTSNMLQQERQAADQTIATSVAQINSGLAQVAQLNQMIAGYGAGSGEIAGLLDQRQQVIDRLATLIPLQELPRDRQQIALISKSGAILLDGTPSLLAFRPTATIVPEMSLASGALSALTLNGHTLDLDTGYGSVAGGALAAQFTLRDRTLVEAQAQLDALAHELVGRFAAADVDLTRAIGAAGLFTDAGSAFDPTMETGLAARLRLNPLVDPVAGGAVWRLRDGLSAIAPGPAGDATLLNRLAENLSAIRPAISQNVSGHHSLLSLGGEVLSQLSTKRVTAEADQAYHHARYTALTDLEARDGVDTDAEMQALLVIEKIYAANAKVIQTVDAMMRLLLEI